MEQKDKMTKSNFDMWYNANFPSMLEDSVFDITEVERNIVEQEEKFYGKRILSVDVARFGRDFTVYALVDKVEGTYRVVDFIQDEHKDTTSVAGRIINLHKKHNFDTILVDEAGVGGGPLDIVREKGIEAVGVIAGSKCTTNDASENCMNLKAELYMKAKKLFEIDKLKIINKGTILKELRGMKKDFSPNGKLKIIDPEKSPDYASALVYALYEPNYGTFVVMNMRGEDTKVGFR